MIHIIDIFYVINIVQRNYKMILIFDKIMKNMQLNKLKKKEFFLSVNKINELNLKNITLI